MPSVSDYLAEAIEQGSVACPTIDIVQFRPAPTELNKLLESAHTTNQAIPISKATGERGKTENKENF